MTKHSKNNTASSIFSYAEYKKLDYGTKKVFMNTMLLAIFSSFESNVLEMTQWNRLIRVVCAFNKLVILLLALPVTSIARSAFMKIYASLRLVSYSIAKLISTSCSEDGDQAPKKKVRNATERGRSGKRTCPNSCSRESTPRLPTISNWNRRKRIASGW